MIKENVKKILEGLPPEVNLVAAAKGKNVEQIKQACQAGIKIIGENYLKEAGDKFVVIGNSVKWHLIGHLQKNKAKTAVKIFDMVETLDSLELADVLDKECKKIGKIMPVLIEINSASEPQKYGVLAEDAGDFLEEALQFSNLKPMGLMTMGPWKEKAEDMRPYFRRTRDLFDRIKINYSDKLKWIYLSMGMSSSYRIAIEEGANIVRVGTAIFSTEES